MSAAGKHGMELWLDKVPTRQTDMKDWEILLSESQERMLVVVEKGKEDIVNSIFDKWDLSCEEIGVVTKGDRVRYFMENLFRCSNDLVLGGGRLCIIENGRNHHIFKEWKKFNIDDVEQPKDLDKVASILQDMKNISKRWVYEQYDSMVGTVNMSTNFPTDVGIVNLKEVIKQRL